MVASLAKTPFIDMFPTKSLSKIAENVTRTLHNMMRASWFAHNFRLPHSLAPLCLEYVVSGYNHTALQNAYITQWAMIHRASQDDGERVGLPFGTPCMVDETPNVQTHPPLLRERQRLGLVVGRSDLASGSSIFCLNSRVVQRMDVFVIDVTEDVIHQLNALADEGTVTRKEDFPVSDLLDGLVQAHPSKVDGEELEEEEEEVEGDPDEDDLVDDDYIPSSKVPTISSEPPRRSARLRAQQVLYLSSDSEVDAVQASGHLETCFILERSVQTEGNGESYLFASSSSSCVKSLVASPSTSSFGSPSFQGAESLALSPDATSTTDSLVTISLWPIIQRVERLATLP